jgi:hypothetical protein
MCVCAIIPADWFLFYYCRVIKQPPVDLWLRALPPTEFSKLTVPLHAYGIAMQKQCECDLILPLRAYRVTLYSKSTVFEH